MKIKTMSKTIVILMLSSLLISCFDEKKSTDSSGSISTTPQEAVKILKKIRDRVATGAITEADEELIKELAVIPIPHPLLISKNVTVTLGVNHLEEKFFLVNPRTGLPVNSCGKPSINKNNEVNVCNTTILNTPNALINAVNITAPIPVLIQKKGEEYPKKGKAFVSIIVKYDGSDCTTTIANGGGTETCSKRPNRR